MTDAQRHAVARKILRAYLARNDVALRDVEAVFQIISGALERLSERSGDTVQTHPDLPATNPFPGWLARQRLTVREAARVLGASTTGVQAWKLDRPPTQVLLACAALSGGCALPPDSGAEDNSFPGWMAECGYTIRQAAAVLETSTSVILRWRRQRPRLYVLLACAALTAGLVPIGDRVPAAASTPDRPTAAEIAASIRPDGLVSFIDGRARRILAPHLSAHDLTPVAYRRRYGLPDDYPMTCAEYGARRAAIAKRIGLGGSLPSPKTG